jgi:predicted lipid-binding transport protein (Tim44 family)
VRRVRWGLLALGALALLAALVFSLIPADLAWARVGGGQTFSTGNSGGGGGGGGGIDGDIFLFLLWLALNYPEVGIPTFIIAVLVIVARGWMKGGRPAPRHVHFDPWTDPMHGHGSDQDGIALLRSADPGFSMPVLLDYLQLVHRRATEAAVSRRWDALTPFVSVHARERLNEQHQDITAVTEVVVGAVSVVGAQRESDRFLLDVRYHGTRLERHTNGSERRVYVEESWRFVRKVTATTAAPDQVTRMGCPSCGSAIDTDLSGACRACGTPIVDGLLQWRAEDAQLYARRTVDAPKVGPSEGGAEPSYHMPTRQAPDLSRHWREFRARHPGFDPQAFQARTQGIFLALQHAWSEGRWADARPYVTDTLYQTLRFMVEQYEQHGLRNRQTDIALLKQEIVKVEIDAWYEAITVRVYGTSKDWVEGPNGKIVGGNPKADRKFSEYWTFLRAIGSGDTLHDPTQCPSCGAPLDRISQAGVCGYCESKITSGQFDWVLSRIDQPQVYRG